MSAQNRTLADLIKLALGALDETPADNHYGALLPEWINEGLQRMIMEGEGVEGAYMLTTTPGVRAYAVPNPPIVPGAITRIKLVTYDGRPLDEIRLLTHDFISAGNGEPAGWTLWNNHIQLGPLPPSRAAQLIIYFYREPALLSVAEDAPEIPNRFRGYLADYATAMMHVADGHLQESQYFMASYEAGVKKYSQWTNEKGRQNFLQVQNLME
jgi:hypothetical protein